MLPHSSLMRLTGLVMATPAWLGTASRLTLAHTTLAAGHCLGGFEAGLSSMLGDSCPLALLAAGAVTGMLGISV